MVLSPHHQVMAAIPVGLLTMGRTLTVRGTVTMAVLQTHELMLDMTEEVTLFNLWLCYGNCGSMAGVQSSSVKVHRNAGCLF